MSAPSLHQRGFALALLPFIVALVLGISYLLLVGPGDRQQAREAALLAGLLRAKEALLARAVNDVNRPGSLPCPDLMTDVASMNNHPGDGRADMLAGNHCPAYLGWLPWLTLDLPELSDDAGEHLWYALSPSLRDDDSAQPINSDTPAELTLDRQTDIAALIIAPGRPLGLQRRPSTKAADYLESGGTNLHFISAPPGENFNDTLITITRAEIMAAAGKRLAGELRACLEQHAESSANPAHRYPWPAPLDNPERQGQAGRLFGRVATTQPGAGAEAALKGNLERLMRARDQVASAPDAQQQIAALKALDDAAYQARQLFDAIYLVNSRLRLAADGASSLLRPLAASISEAAGNGHISRSEASAIRAFDTGSTLDLLATLLGEFGNDVFPWELRRRSAAVASAQTAEQLSETIAEMQKLLFITHSPRLDFAQLIANTAQSARQAYADARSAVQDRAPASLSRARDSAQALLDSADFLEQSIAASRVNITARELADFPEMLEDYRSKLSETGSETNLSSLLNALANSRQAVAGISTGLASIIAARDASLTTLSAALQATQSSPPKISEITLLTGLAGTQIQTLGLVLAANESSDNNLGRTSLLETLKTFRAAQAQFASIDTATPWPGQNDLLAPAEALGDATLNIDTWLKIIATNSSANALLAKAEAAPSETAIATAKPLEQSALARAKGVLDSIEGSRGSLAAWQSYTRQPSDQNRGKAMAASATSLEQTERLLEQARAMSDTLKSSLASAFPMVWNGARCNFLNLGTASWWNNNRWADSLFYQISKPLKGARPTLTVNDSGAYPLVVIASGPALPGQQRGMPGIINFLEGINAAPSRDGDALAPNRHFSASAPGPGFNDRLSWQ